jgi:hypothetical protein
MLADILLIIAWVCASLMLWNALKIKRLDHIGQNRVEHFRRNLK